MSSLVITLDFSEVIIAVAVSLLSSPFAIAVFLITASSVASSTITVNSTTASSPAGTVTIHFNPITSPFSLTSVKFSGVVSGTTYVVFSGILSEISISFRSCVPLFFTVILYVIFSPAYTTFSPASVIVSLITSKFGVVASIFAVVEATTTLAGVHQSQ